MELTLTHQTRTRISVHCDGSFSHTFQLPLLESSDATAFRSHPMEYGIKLYEALFSPASLAQRTLRTAADRLVLVTSEDDIDAIAWEYTYGPDGFLVLKYPFVRLLPTDQRVPPAPSTDSLRIIAIPSHPLSHDLAPLNIEEEWLRLQEIIEELPYAITLERTRPATLERTRHLLAGQKGQVVHFMGHGDQGQQEAVLCFEHDDGGLQKISARELTPRIRDTTFLIVLNACVSAAPGPTSFSNLAAALVRQKIPYALGMRLNISDRDARTFSRVFYSELARGVSVEESLFQTRLALADTGNARCCKQQKYRRKCNHDKDLCSPCSISSKLCRARPSRAGGARLHTLARSWLSHSHQRILSGDDRAGGAGQRGNRADVEQ